MIEQGKQYQTKGKHEVRIYATDGGGKSPVHGAIKIGEDWIAQTYTADGVCSEPNGNLVPDYFDLVEVRPRQTREVWLNIYPEGVTDCVYGYSNPSAAERYMHTSGLEARAVKATIEYEVGEGL
jgi:hypothetical protein